MIVSSTQKASAKGNFPTADVKVTIQIVFIQSRILLTLKSLKVYLLDKPIILLKPKIHLLL